MQFFSGISKNILSYQKMLSLTECVWEFRNNALWDTHQHALLMQAFPVFIHYQEVACFLPTCVLKILLFYEKLLCFV